MFTITINQTLVVSNSVNIRVDEHIVLLNRYKSDKQLKIGADHISHTEYWSSKTT